MTRFEYLVLRCMIMLLSGLVGLDRSELIEDIEKETCRFKKQLDKT